MRMRKPPKYYYRCMGDYLINICIKTLAVIIFLEQSLNMLVLKLS